MPACREGRRLAAKGFGTFKFWFNSSDKVSEKVAAAAHMREVETVVRKSMGASAGRMTFEFLKTGSRLSLM